MVEKVEAIVKSELLSWARKSSGLSAIAAAKKIGTTAERILAWEQGDRRPTIKQLRKMGEVYKRPIAVFYLPIPPKGFDPIKDFRRISEKEPHEYISQLVYEIRRAYTRRQSAIDLYKGLEGELPEIEFPKVRITTDPEKAADLIRQFLGITYEAQKKWSDERESFNCWRAAIEAKDILVFQSSRIPIEEMRGFSITKIPFPVIAVNIQDVLVARTFTLIHELAHVIIGQEGVCDLDGHADIEVFCNAIAGATLVPAKILASEPEFKSTSTNKWNDENISQLANRYKVSREVILRRLLTLNSISSTFYKSKTAEYREIRAKMLLQERRKKKGFASPSRMAISSLGKLFAQLVLNSYYREKITASDVSDLLSVKLNHLQNIEMALFPRHGNRTVG